MAVLITATALLASLGIYSLTCYITPWRTCRRCTGNGRAQHSDRGQGRAASGRHQCHRCRGKGARLRFGIRLTNRWRAVATTKSKW